MSPLRTLRQIIRPTGQHRAPAPRPAVSQGLRHCPPCGTTTAAVLHRDSHTCGDCGHTTYPKGGSDA
ncbi:hypothetical protein [Streptomyces sp. NPDC016845]|uniref:hypothetical protein n=1 Tax=Streptomyces sp. NPDC016845 TaxID=3364972 RepID=UPI0037BA3709